MTLWGAALMALALLQETPLADPKQEARALALMQEIRCVACENEPISQSASEIAEDMRAIVRQQVEAGRTDAEIRDWFAERYDEFVLFRPSAKGIGGTLLWGLPFALLLIGATVVAFVAGRRQRGEVIRAERPEDV